MRPILPAYLSLCTLVAACTGSPPATDSPPRLVEGPKLTPLDHGPPPPLTRIAIALGGPIPVDNNPGSDTVRFQATVDVPAGLPSGGEALVLSGVYGTATVSLNGVVVATVAPGPGPTEIDLSGKVPPGAHAVDISLRRVGAPPPMILGGDRRTTPMLVDPPVLLLRPAAHVTRFAVPLAGGMATPIAAVAGAPDGATVHFVATQDGKVVADLGAAPVIGGTASAPAVAWALPQWQMKAPALYNLFALLEAADGTLLDAYGTRMGPREIALSATGFDIGGVSSRLVGWRSGARPFTPADFGPLVRTGGNAFEFHGSPPTDHQLGVFDETGIAVVLTPRCEGTFSIVPEPERASIVELNLPLILDQSVRSAWDVARHPSVVLWVSESRTLTALGQAIADADPEHRPVVNKHLPMENVTLGRVTARASYVGAWVGETAWEGPVGAVDVTIEAFGEALREGVRGGILEHVENPAREVAWAPLLTEQKIPPIKVAGRRGNSRVVASGAVPGQVLWIEAPWLPAEAVLATVSEVGMDAWYRGPATVVIGERRHPVELFPQVWSEAGLTGGIAKVPGDIAKVP